MGPVITTRKQSANRRANRQGRRAKVRRCFSTAEPERSSGESGNFLKPTILDNVPAGSALSGNGNLWACSQPGPCKDLDEGIEILSRSKYGNMASIFTSQRRCSSEIPLRSSRGKHWHQYRRRCSYGLFSVQRLEATASLACFTARGETESSFTRTRKSSWSAGRRSGLAHSRVALNGHGGPSAGNWEGSMASSASQAVGNVSSAPVMNRWWVVVGGVMMNMALGTFYAVSAFMLPLEKDFGWTRAQTSWVTTFGIVMIACWFVVGGLLNDRKGPRFAAAIGGVLFSSGFFLASQIHSLVAFYLTLGVCVGAGNGFGYVVPTAVGSKWFPDKRGLIVGLMVGGYGAGSGIFGPVASSLIERVGWRSTFQILAGIFFVMTMIATYLLKNPPAGYSPAGWDPSRVGAKASRSPDVPASQMIRTRTFWALWVAYCLGTTAGTMVISQLVPFARASGYTRGGSGFRDHGGRSRKRLWPHLLRMDLRPCRPREYPAHHAPDIRDRDARALLAARDSCIVLRALVRRLLLLRHAALRLCLHQRGLLRHEEPRFQLRVAAACMGRCRDSRAVSSVGACTSRRANTAGLSS